MGGSRGVGGGGGGGGKTRGSEPQGKSQVAKYWYRQWVQLLHEGRCVWPSVKYVDD